MIEPVLILSLTALSIGFLHTVLGPDHYVPFVAMARVGRWSLRKTLIVTLLCGLGHVLSSVVLGFIGIAFGIAVLKLESIETVRGDIAGWLLLMFGLVYLSWGVRRAVLNKPHTHNHAHSNGITHSHKHAHHADHLHAHAASADLGTESARVGAGPDGRARSETLTPWILFTIFLFGPCEPLIPLLMYPAARDSLWGTICVTLFFCIATLATMSVIVTAAYLGIGTMRFAKYQRYGHALAGLAVVACGIAVKVGF